MSTAAAQLPTGDVAGGAKVAGEGRIPKTLQAVFLASNRGKEIDKPPPKQVAFKTFFRSFMGKGSKKSKETKEKDEQAIASSYQKGKSSSKSKKSDKSKPPKPEKKVRFVISTLFCFVMLCFFLFFVLLCSALFICLSVPVCALFLV